MKKELVDYFKLNSKQKELYNFQILTKILGNYGYLCTRLSADWSDADFVAQHYKTGQIYRIQQKSRLTIDKKYENNNLYIAFPYNGRWFIILHDKLVDIVSKTTDFLKSDSWIQKGKYSTDKPSKKLLDELVDYEWQEITVPCRSGQRRKE